MDGIRKKWLRIQVSGNPVFLRIEVTSHKLLIDDIPLEQVDLEAYKAAIKNNPFLRLLNGDDEPVASFSIPSILGWWIENENPPEESGPTGKHLFIDTPGDPVPYISIGACMS